MVHSFVLRRAHDSDAWRPACDGFAAVQKDGGVRGRGVFQALDEANPAS